MMDLMMQVKPKSDSELDDSASQLSVGDREDLKEQNCHNVNNNCFDSNGTNNEHTTSSLIMQMKPGIVDGCEYKTEIHQKDPCEQIDLVSLSSGYSEPVKIRQMIFKATSNKGENNVSEHDHSTGTDGVGKETSSSDIYEEDVSKGNKLVAHQMVPVQEEPLSFKINKNSDIGSQGAEQPIGGRSQSRKSSRKRKSAFPVKLQICDSSCSCHDGQRSDELSSGSADRVPEYSEWPNSSGMQDVAEGNAVSGSDHPPEFSPLGTQNRMHGQRSSGTFDVNASSSCSPSQEMLEDTYSEQNECDLPGASSFTDSRGTPSKEKPYNCEFCNAEFAHRGSLHKHKRIHSGEKPYKCEVCNVGFTLNSHLQRHKRIHTGEKPYKCEVCNAGFTDSGHLQRHKKIHIGEKPYECEVCGAGFTRRRDLKRHNSKHVGEENYSCEFCDARFAQSYDLLEHVRIHTGEMPYTCDICGSSFAQKSGLNRHRKAHAGETPFKCEICGAGFTRSADLSAHRRRHNGELPFKCEFCGESFAQIAGLHSHKKIHLELPYKCDICGAAFGQKSQLTVHRRVHTGEKPYNCVVCGTSFAQVGHLNVHKRIHTGEKPYKCDVCSSSFASNSELRNHRRTHTGEKPYVCEACGMRFVESGHLQRHKRTHTGEKPYKCDICGARFRGRSTLKSHGRTHTGERPYKCEICGAAFTQSSGLKKHNLIHTRWRFCAMEEPVAAVSSSSPSMVRAKLKVKDSDDLVIPDESVEEEIDRDGNDFQGENLSKFEQQLVRKNTSFQSTLIMQMKPNIDHGCEEYETEIHRKDASCKPVVSYCKGSPESGYQSQNMNKFQPIMDDYAADGYFSQKTAETEPTDSVDDCKDADSSNLLVAPSIAEPKQHSSVINKSNDHSAPTAEQPCVSQSSKSSRSRKRKSSVPVKLKVYPTATDGFFQENESSDIEPDVLPDISSDGAEDVHGYSQWPGVNKGLLNIVSEGAFSRTNFPPALSQPTKPLDRRLGHSSSCTFENRPESLYGSSCQGKLEKTQLRQAKATCTLLENPIFVNGKKKRIRPRPYKCNYCGAGFSGTGNLQRHKRTHTGEKPYKCVICNAQFAESGHLRRHERTHTGEKPYKCELCSASFAQSGDLRRHGRTHIGEKSYRCEICGAQFGEKSHLQRHHRTHTGEKPYKCEVCGAGFAERGNLQKHERTHSGKRPYKCDICGSSFAQSGSLQIHLRTHTGERPYKCDICDAGFSQAGNLQRHKRLHAGIKRKRPDSAKKRLLEPEKNGPEIK
ncbi:zinc finger protein 226 [Aplysia californica]|uniref:Zinc finger protein 226 n=1 Tax=Aplysia californica TaxID=6500 RepID=A0ABM1W400_APLCA|nr:zinc finger protein 226 [Aplysia californica]